MEREIPREKFKEIRVAAGLGLAVAGGMAIDVEFINRFGRGLTKGDVVRAGKIVYVGNLPFMREIFTKGDRADGYLTKGPTQDILIQARLDDEGTGGLIGEDGIDWMDIRNPLKDFFRKSKILGAENKRNTYNKYSAWINSRDSGKEFNIYTDISELTFRAVMSDLFGIDEIPEEYAHMYTHIRELFGMSVPQALLPEKLSSKLVKGIDLWRKRREQMSYEETKDHVNNFVDYVIAENVKGKDRGGWPPTIVISLLEAIEKGEMPARNLKDTIAQILAASIGTTANTSTLVLESLDKLPKHKRRQFYDAVKARPLDVLLDPQDPIGQECQDLIHELVGKHAQTPLLFRGVKRDVEITYVSKTGERRFPLEQDDKIIVFLDEVIRSAAAAGEDANDVVFSLGPRVCIGMLLARMRMAMLIKAIADSDKHIKFPWLRIFVKFDGEATPRGWALTKTRVLRRR